MIEWCISIWFARIIQNLHLSVLLLVGTMISKTEILQQDINVNSFVLVRQHQTLYENNVLLLISCLAKQYLNPIFHQKVLQNSHFILCRRNIRYLFFLLISTHWKMLSHALPCHNFPIVQRCESFHFWPQWRWIGVHTVHTNAVRRSQFATSLANENPSKRTISARGVIDRSSVTI